MSDRPETRMIGLAGIAIFPDRMRALQGAIEVGHDDDRIAE